MLNRLFAIGRKTIAPTIIISVILFVIAFKPLYYIDMMILDIPEKSGYSRQAVKENYDYLVNYSLSVKTEKFDLPGIVYTDEARNHFDSVRRMIRTIIFAGMICSILSVFGVIDAIRKKDYRIFRNTGIAVLIIPIVLSTPFIMNFNKSFLIFHKIFFRNGYWEFNPDVDPVINILPEEFFMHSAVLMLILMIAASVIMLYIYRRFRYEYKIRPEIDEKIKMLEKNEEKENGEDE